MRLHAIALLFLSSEILTGCAPARTVREPQNGKAFTSSQESACVAHLCVPIDQTIARQVQQAQTSRCLVTVWAGEQITPPTPRIGVLDEPNARPGIFAMIDVPSLAMEREFPVMTGTESTHSASVFAAKIGLLAQVQEQAVAQTGWVRIKRHPAGVLLQLDLESGSERHQSSIVLPLSKNGCPLRIAPY